MSKLSRREHPIVRERPKWDRQFLGKVKDFDSKEEQKFENKHLKAYLKGHEQFAFGTEIINNREVPKFYEVKSTLTKR